MFCPSCNEELDKEYAFCPNCGKPVPKVDDTHGLSLNLGDANAISGGVHLSDSHNVSNVDQRVINTSTVSNVTNNITQFERQKTEQEAAEDRKNRFIECCKEVYADGILEDWESAKLEAKRLELGIDASTATQLIELARRSMNNRLTALAKKDEITMKLVIRMIECNQKEKLEGQLSRLKTMAKYYQVDEVRCIYNMIMAALHPYELIKEFEELPADEYWQTYWVSLSYMKSGEIVKAEESLAKLNFFKQYSEYNDVLLSAINMNHDFGVEGAKEMLEVLDEQSCSPELRKLFYALCVEIEPERAESMGVDKRACEFFLENIIPLGNPRKSETPVADKNNEQAEKANGIKVITNIELKPKVVVQEHETHNPQTMKPKASSVTLSMIEAARETARKEKEWDKTAAKTAYMIINRVEFANATKDSKLLSNYGDVLNEHDMRCLKARICYDSLHVKEPRHTLGVKIITPEGDLKTVDNSARRYSFREDVVVKVGNKQAIELKSYGKDDMSIFKAGTYGFELWYNDACIYRTNFVVKRKL